MANSRLTVAPVGPTVAAGGWNTSTTAGTGASVNNITISPATILAGSTAAHLYTPYSGANILQVSFGTATIPATGQVRGAFVSFTGEYAQGTGSAGGSHLTVTLSPPGQSALGSDIFTMSSIGSGGSGTGTMFRTWAGIPLTSSQVSGMTATFVSGGPSEARLYTATLYVDYNLAPSNTVNITGIVAGAIPTLTPTVTWTYTDPESDYQERYRVQIYAQSDLSHTVYDSGEIHSSATTHTVPIGFLRNFIPYRVKVTVSDFGSSGRYNTVNWGVGTGGANEALDFLPVIDPLLMPALRFPSSPDLPSRTFSPATANITPIVYRARVNLLPTVDSTLLSGGSPNVGSWVVNGSTGIGATVTAANTHPFRSSSSLVLTAASSSGTTVGAKSGAVAVSPGQILTGTGKVGGNTASTAVKLGIAFYSDAGGTSLITTVFSTPQATNTSKYTTFHVTTRVPTSSVSARLILTIASSNSSNYSATCFALAPNVINLADDASFENTGDVFWAYSAAGGNTAAASVSDPGASWNSGYFSARLARTAAGSAASVASASELPIPGLKYIVSGDFDYITGVPAPGSGACDFGFLLDDASTVPATISSATTLPLNVSARRSVIADASATSTSRHGSLFIQPSAAPGAQTMSIDNIAVELVWPFTDGTFESAAYAPSTALLPANALGQDTHYWMSDIAAGSSSTAIISSGANHTGTKSLLLTVPISNTPISAEQFFTVSGYTSLTLDWWEQYSNALIETTLTFYDNAGVVLSTATTGTIRQSVSSPLTLDSRFGTQASFIHVSPAAVTVPTTAAYARLRYTLSAVNSSIISTCYIDDVTFTPTGTLSCSTPWIDGGWSGGGHKADQSALVQRYNPDTTTWDGVRIPPSPTSTLAPVTSLSTDNNFELTYTDYEWPVESPFSPQTIQYRAATLFNSSSIQSPYSTTASLVAFPTSLQTTEWVLIDPLYPTTNLSLQVKSAKFENDESMGTFVGVGHNRRIIVGDVVLGDHISLELETFSAAQHDALTAAINSQNTHLLRNPDGDMWYVRCVKRSRERVWTGTYVRPFRTYTVEFDQVDVLD